MEAKTVFETLKKDIEKWIVCARDEHVPFEVESDASEFAIATTLNQNGRPVAFFSHTLQGAEIRHASIEKEAQAIIETILHRKHYLMGRHFSIKTDNAPLRTCLTTKRETRSKMTRLCDGGWSYPVIALTWYTNLEQKISPQIRFLDHSVLLSQLDLTLLTFVIRFVSLELPLCSITLSPWSYPYVPLRAD